MQQYSQKNISLHCVLFSCWSVCVQSILICMIEAYSIKNEYSMFLTV
jgi:hypothetical protein